MKAHKVDAKATPNASPIWGRGNPPPCDKLMLIVVVCAGDLHKSDPLQAKKNEKCLKFPSKGDVFLRSYIQ